MNLGNQVEWALHCMTILAGMPADVHVPSKVLAELHGVPKEYLSKCLQLLSNDGLVITTLGPKGGYRLAKPAHQISLLEIVEAVEGKKKTFQCHEIRKNNPCKPSKKSLSSVCSIAEVMYKADEAWRSVLRQAKLSEILAEVQVKVEPQDMQKTADWLASKLS